jgi:predicted nucleic acid-binding protein
LGIALFVDTSAFYALADESDGEHGSVWDVYQSRAERSDLVTTDFVMVETSLLIRARLGPDASRQWWRGIRSGPVAIVGVTADDLERAWDIDQKFSDQHFGLIDSSCFAVIERLGIEEALSVDRHFRAVRLGSRWRRALRIMP